MVPSLEVIALHGPRDPPVVLNTALRWRCARSAGDLRDLVPEPPRSGRSRECLGQAELVGAAWGARVDVHVVALDGATQCGKGNTAGLPGNERKYRKN